MSKTILAKLKLEKELGIEVSNDLEVSYVTKNTYRHRPNDIIAIQVYLRLYGERTFRRITLDENENIKDIEKAKEAVTYLNDRAAYFRKRLEDDKKRAVEQAELRKSKIETLCENLDDSFFKKDEYLNRVQHRSLENGKQLSIEAQYHVHNNTWGVRLNVSIDNLQDIEAVQEFLQEQLRLHRENLVEA